jgi:hypothetical protein
MWYILEKFKGFQKYVASGDKKISIVRGIYVSDGSEKLLKRWFDRF